MALSLPEGKAELVRGELRMTPPAGGPHGTAASNLLAALIPHVKTHNLGRVYPDGVGYRLLDLPRTVRAPDGSFVRRGRLPPGGIEPGLITFAPDLAIEVLSPSETAWEIEEKLEDYAASGTSMVVIADPVRRTVMLVPRDGPVRHLHEGDTLDLGDVIPGFSMPVADVFEGIARRR